MTPAVLASPNMAFRAFGWTNVVFFTMVVVVTVKYHHKMGGKGNRPRGT
jgi:hypothetical protein